MIWYLNWNVKYIWEKYIILNVNWVWYKLWLWTESISNIIEKKEKDFWIHTIVKENEISLYWFLEKESLDFFEILIWVNWVGPKTALEILNLPLDILKSAIVNWDAESLKQVKWIGQKAAERIIVDLKSKISHIVTMNTGSIWSKDDNTILSEAILALESLWFNRNEIVKKIRNTGKMENAEEMVRWFLSEI